MATTTLGLRSHLAVQLHRTDRGGFGGRMARHRITGKRAVGLSDRERYDGIGLGVLVLRSPRFGNRCDRTVGSGCAHGSDRGDCIPHGATVGRTTTSLPGVVGARRVVVVGLRETIWMIDSSRPNRQ